MVQVKYFLFLRQNITATGGIFRVHTWFWVQGNVWSCRINHKARPSVRIREHPADVLWSWTFMHLEIYCIVWPYTCASRIDANINPHLWIKIRRDKNTQSMEEKFRTSELPAVDIPRRERLSISNLGYCACVHQILEKHQKEQNWFYWPAA